MRETKLVSLVQLYLCCHFYNRASENFCFESDKFPFLFWKKIPKIPVLELAANKIGETFLDYRLFVTADLA